MKRRLQNNYHDPFKIGRARRSRNRRRRGHLEEQEAAARDRLRREIEEMRAYELEAEGGEEVAA